MNDKPHLSSFLHLLLELTLVGAAVAAFGLLLLLAGSSRIGGLR